MRLSHSKVKVEGMVRAFDWDSTYTVLTIVHSSDGIHCCANSVHCIESDTFCV